MGEPGGGETVLILEDDPGIVLLERRRLERAGFEVATAADPAEARRRIERGGVDLMVLDYRLDGEASGLDFHNELREAGLGVASVLVTGFGDAALLARALRSGVRDFLPKTPDYLDYLVPTVRRVIDQVRTERQLEAERAQRARERAALAEAEARRAALAESEARFRGLTQAIPQLVWSCRADGQADFTNRPWSEYTGQAPDEALGGGWMRVVHPDDLPAFADAWSAALAAGAVFQTRCRVRRAADGAYRWHLARAFPQRDEAGRVARWFGTCTDVDDQTRAEEALRDADRHKDEFLAVLAHELRNPLAAIRNAVALALRPDGEGAAWAVGVIDRQSETLSRLIDDLLDVSRVRTGKLRLRPRRVDASALVARAAEAVRPLIESKRLTLDLDVAPGPLPLDADPTRLEQVLVNLLTNAAKYTDEGGRVDLRACREGAEVVIRVRDSGVGIPAEMLPRVFDMFTQVEGSLDRAGGGLGIGLTLVRRLVGMHRGTVTAASEGPGRGSEFTVRLPAPAPNTTPDPDADPPHDPRPAAAGPRRVLVVDDDADTAQGMARLLRASGHETRTAGDGRSALEAARAFRPEVVLMDVRLPDADGYDVAARIRAESGLGRPLIVAVSGVGPGDPARPGFDRHLVKPVDLDAVLALVAAGAGRPANG